MSNTLLSYIHNRFISPSHKITIKNSEYGVGSYHDPDHQLLYSSFQILVDYVEIDCTLCGDDHLNTPIQNLYELLTYIPGIHWFLPPTRNAMQGLLRLKWEMTQTDSPHQAESAAAFYTLYKFWVHDRPTRINPWDLVSDKESEDFVNSIKSGKPLRFSKEYSHQLTQAQELEDKYHVEDEEMLHLLIKHHRCLWV